MGSTKTPAEQAQTWLDALAAALASGDGGSIDALFLEESYWRDLIALTWDTQQFWGRDAVTRELPRYAKSASLSNLALDPARTAPRTVTEFGKPFIEFFFTFDTAVGRGRGFAALAPDESSKVGARARNIATELVALDCAPENVRRHPWQGYDLAYPGQTWAEHLAAKSSFRDRDPDVLIIGGGHSGLCIGARLERMGVSYLIVDKEKKPGDVWRGRYESLVLHTNTAANDLPYIELPKHWGSYTPKEQWADWIESYVKLMNLNYWSSTELLGGTFDETSREWNIRIRLADGSLRTMRPKHVVLAVGGVGSEPRVPELPGLKDFRGEVLHSSAYKTGVAFRGRKVLVVGTSTSAHDICLDLYHKGATVTMMQRGPACVVNINEVERMSADYSAGLMSKDEADQRRSANAIRPLMVKRMQANTVLTEIEYAELHAGLRKAGMKLTIGDDRTGWRMKLVRDLSGYYINVGCSEVIAAGGIKMMQSDDVAHFVPEGVQLRDGSVSPFDAVILATGFHNLSVKVEDLFGPEIARKVGRVGGIADEDGEPRNACRPTGQLHLWMIFGGIVDARKSSPLLAFQLKANLEGLVPSFARQADGRIKPLPEPAASTREAAPLAEASG